MANELAVVEENWLDLAGKFKDLPMPFERTVFLTEYRQEYRPLERYS